jgi:hypothetical protein
VKMGGRWCQTCARIRRLAKFTPKYPDGKSGAHRQPMCKNGHVYDGTEKISKGTRICGRCRKASYAKYRQRRKALTTRSICDMITT